MGRRQSLWQGKSTVCSGFRPYGKFGRYLDVDGDGEPQGHLECNPNKDPILQEEAPTTNMHHTEDLTTLIQRNVDRLQKNGDDSGKGWFTIPKLSHPSQIHQNSEWFISGNPFNTLQKA